MITITGVIDKTIMRIAKFTIILSLILTTNCQTTTIKQDFDEKQALQDITYQVTLGPRTIGSIAHQQVIDWASDELEKAGWEVSHQSFNWASQKLTNIIASRGNGNPWILIGAHYDSRFISDQDPDPKNQNNPMPGANDGASGVAVLLEIARSLPPDLDKQIWIVLFDAEDNGNIPGWDWIIGSRVFVANLSEYPDSVVIIDMVGDADLNLYLERNSSQELLDEIWGIAYEKGYSQFIPEPRHQILDDHIPFIELGIPAVDIIDFDYPYWHTTQDTVDKISPESLDAVGEVLLEWLIR